MEMPSFDIATLRAAYLCGSQTPVSVVEEVIRRTAADPRQVWIHRLPDATLREAALALSGRDPATLPLYGIPFAIKDNIDLAGVPTSAGCREYTYVPGRSAFVVERLIAAGAIPVGKTNLDQFATGLNGTRSPFGSCHNAFNPEYISGGSSAGSAVAVALGYASFSLGTDTAGSGRVPAAFNNLIGHKPTLGWLSTRGVVPACRSLDAVSIFALTATDANSVLSVAAEFDAEDPYSRPLSSHGFDFGRADHFHVGIPRPEDLAFFGNEEAARLFHEAVARITALGCSCVEVDFSPFLETAKLLYNGPWVAERYAAIREFFDAHETAVLPVIREIVGGAKRWSAADAYDYGYRLKIIKRQCDALWSSVDCFLTPTAGTIYSIAEMKADPIRLNSNLGYYTNFMNLLDYAATAVPAGFQSNGIPFGVTVFAPAAQDTPLLHLADRLQRALAAPMGATNKPLPAMPVWQDLPSGQVRVAVCGAHLSGLPLNSQLTSRSARLVSSTRTAPEYRLYALSGGPPKRPGMVRVGQRGSSIEVEVWELPAREFGSFVAGIPSPLGIGTIRLADNSMVQGFLCEAVAVTGSEDITHYGGWRSYVNTRAPTAHHLVKPS
jgi:allophanate hydrolase